MQQGIQQHLPEALLVMWKNLLLYKPTRADLEQFFILFHFLCSDPFSGRAKCPNKYYKPPCSSLCDLELAEGSERA